MQVALRPLRESDGGAVHRLISDIEVVRYMAIPLSCSAEASAGFVRGCIAEPRFPTFAITCGDDTLAGLCGLVLQHEQEAAEIWYLIDPACAGKGVATAAARELLRMGFEERGMHRLWATCCPENAASARVLEKAGLRSEGLQRRSLRIQGEWRDTYLYAVLEEEWRRPGRRVSVEHVALWVSDLDASAQFFCSWFGGEAGSIYRSATRPFTSCFVALQSGARIELMQMPGEAPRVAHIAVAVGSREGVDALAAEMEQAGVAVVNQPRLTGDGYYEAVVADPDGNPIEIVA